MKTVDEVVVKTCLIKHPDAVNEVEAVDMECQDIYKKVVATLNENKDANLEIELYWTLIKVKADLNDNNAYLRVRG